ncbi:MAG: cation-translocating P-type ATPase [Candidatus Diapherotrites archaeon]|nr:cation-translocating P-type ATPase [Candidatus Diapherotrites archaeon]
MTDWHSLEADNVFKKLEASKKGLSAKEAGERLEKYGKNAIEKKSKISALKIFISQFTDFLILILLAAAVISYFMSFIPGEEDRIFDTILISAILIANAIIGFIQEYKAEKSIQALQKMSAPKSNVIRDGVLQEIDSELVVPGDILVLEQGDKVTADARIIEEANLQTNESALTGESLPVSKIVGALKEHTVLAEMKNMVFMDTIVVRGRARVVVTGTGMSTELGKIAEQVAETEEKQTPFQEELDKLGKKLGIMIMIIIAFVAALQFFLGMGRNPLDIFMAAVSLAVAAVPEGLPAIVTLALTIGVRTMAKKNALARRLPVAESLGSVDTICTDKTGTLTENVMTVRKVFSSDIELDVSGEGFATEGKFSLKGKESDPDKLEELLKCGVLCNDATEGADEHGKTKFMGDPTEIALIVSAEKAGLDTKLEREKYHRVSEIQFSSERKMMTVVCMEGSKKTAYSKGAPEILIGKCAYILSNGKKEKLSPKDKEEILKKNSEWGGQALRVLGFAYKEVGKEIKDEEIERDLVFIGMQGMIDPPRAGVREALEDCRKAGIKVVMVTGDNINTAKAIGKELGFAAEGALSGYEIEEISDEKLAKVLEKTEIFARVDPAHKVKILEALQKTGRIVAMTGDGVNDAPALKRADVGIAMGIRGTDVAKETSDLVLLDDNFITIRDAVAEGRGIFDNIKKFVNYLLSSNTAEVLAVFIFTLLALAINFGPGAVILTAAQLLWINLLTDGLPAIALGLDPKSEFVMKRKPRKKNEGVIDKRMLFSIITIGIAMAAVILGVFLWEFFYSEGTDLTEKMVRAQTAAFTCFIIFEMVRVQTVRASFRTKLLTNKWLWMAVSASVILQLVVLYTPLNTFFRVVPLTINELDGIVLGAIVFIALTILIVKAEDRLFGQRER